MNAEISKAAQYLKVNRLSLNVKKTQDVMFSMRKWYQHSQTVKIVINDKPTDIVKEACFLGVIIDKQLIWNHHIDQIYSKMVKGAFKLSRQTNRTVLYFYIFILSTL